MNTPGRDMFLPFPSVIESGPDYWTATVSDGIWGKDIERDSFEDYRTARATAHMLAWHYTTPDEMFDC